MHFLEDCEKVKTLYGSIGKIITTSLRFEDILDSIMQEIQAAFEAENWSLLRFDETQGELFFVIVEGVDIDKVRNIRLKQGEGIAGYVVSTGNPVFVADVRKDEHFSNKVDQASGFETRSILAVPIKYREKLYGVIELVNRYDGENFTQNEYLILQTIADFAGIAFANAHLYQNALLLSQTDPLTGAGNVYRLETYQNRFLEIHPEKEIRMILIDLDNFKELNDQHGHINGDRALQWVANSLKILPDEEINVFRIGGDEFLVVMENTSEEKYMEYMQLVEAEVRSSGFPFPINYSAGSASGKLTDLQKLKAEADEEMYSDKRVKTR